MPTPPPSRKSRSAASRQTGPTLDDVARVTGLSAITVSRALNNPHMVRPETIEKVREAVEMTGYIPNMLAGGLSSRRSRLVATVVPQLTNTMFVDTVQGLSDQLAAHGYHQLLCLTGYSMELEDELVSAILSRRPDGVVLTGINHSQKLRKKLLSASLPVVETWDLTPTPIDMLVGFSHEKIGNAIGRYLISRGYRHFGLVWANDERAALRRRGLEEVLHQNGIAHVPAAMVPTPATLQLGREGMTDLLSQHSGLDVIVCSSDALAQGVIIEAKTRGYAVPGELAVMGFGDLDFSAHTVPPISTVHIDKRAVGVRAADALVAKIEGRPMADNVIDVGFELVERGST
jgi:LacI family gluconate utilization system Gnt-I transcriptional repressor